MKKRLIERWFPVKDISRDAGIEMAYKSAPAYIKHARELGIVGRMSRDFYDPKLRNLHPWFARRPCSAARAVTLSSIVSEEVDENTFMNAIGWKKKKDVYFQNNYPPLLFYTDPDVSLISEILEKEGKNLDEIVVCDPMAGGGAIPFESLRLGFKTVAVDYNPVAYIILKATIEFPAKYGEELASRVRNEAKNFITFAEKTLGEFYPENTEGYIFARGIKCPGCDGLIPLIGESEIAEKSYLYFHFDEGNFTPYLSKFKSDLPHIRGREIICPYCKKKLEKLEAYKIWTENHIKILDDLLSGKISEKEILSTHMLLVRQTRNGYKIADSEDLEAFLNACRRLAATCDETRKYIPLGSIPDENEVFEPLKSYGVYSWYQLFNPRQLLSLSILIKYINNRIQSLNPSDEIGRAAMLYLALGVSRVVDYNTIATTWKKGTIRDTIGQYARNRRIYYGDAYCEAIVPRRNLNWVFEVDARKTQGGIIPVLNELCRRLEGRGKNVSVIHGDARRLSSFVEAKFDLINVDPPYFDVHIYSDVSELFWQVLKLALGKLIESVFENKKLEWDVKSHAVPREGELIVRKNNSKNEIWYAKQMLEFFREAYNSLKDDGLLVVWFTHKTLNAWKAVISALYGSNFYIEKIWPVTTELLTRLVARKNNVLDRTLIIVAKKKFDVNLDMEEHAKRLAKEIVNSLRELEASSDEMKTFLYAAVMGSVTVQPVVDNPVEHCYSELIPKAMELARRLEAGG